MSLTAKAYLEEDGRVKEVRRFALPDGVATTYDSFVQKVALAFPSLQDAAISTFWKDADGDRVTFSSDGELHDALRCSQGDMFKVYLEASVRGGTATERQAGDSSAVERAFADQLHAGVTCDGCGRLIRGIRYKCVACTDFDLCSDCERKCLHAEHDMLRIVMPRGSNSACQRLGSHDDSGPCCSTARQRSAVEGFSDSASGGGGGSLGLPLAAAGSSSPSSCSSAGGTAVIRAQPACELAAAAQQLEPLSSLCTEEDREVDTPAKKQKGAGAAAAVADSRATGEAASEAGRQGTANRTWLPAAGTRSAGVGVTQSSVHMPSASPYGVVWPGSIPQWGAATGTTYPFWPSFGTSAYCNSRAFAAPGNGHFEPHWPQQDPVMEARVANAVNTMQAMGFRNEDGWLTALLRSNGCDIPKTIDEVVRVGRRS